MLNILNGFILLLGIDDCNAEVAIAPHVSLWFLLRRQREAGAWDGMGCSGACEAIPDDVSSRLSSLFSKKFRL